MIELYERVARSADIWDVPSRRLLLKVMFFVQSY